MQVIESSISGVKVLIPHKHGDHRGFFSETYSQRSLAEVGIMSQFVQDNHSLSERRGTVRGLHFQIPPFTQDKLIHVIRGSIYDVAVDLRHGSPTYGKHVALVLSAKEWNQIFIPKGFAHGLCTLEPGTEVLYKVSDYYKPDAERGLLWNDPALAIRWPLPEADVLLLERDRGFPPLSKLEAFF